MEQASYCFKQLFTSFRFRGVVESAEEPVYTDKYLFLVDELRRLHSDLQQPILLIAEAIDFISGKAAPMTTRHLTRIFGISCLCLDKPRFSFPAVSFGSMFDVVAPFQSFIGNGSRGLDALTPDSSVTRSLKLERNFSNTGLDSTYSLWDSIEHLGGYQISEGINSCRRTSTEAESHQPSTSKSPKVFPKSPGKSATQRSALESEQALSSKPSNLSGGSAKLQLYHMYNCAVDLFPFMYLYFSLFLFISFIVVKLVA